MWRITSFFVLVALGFVDSQDPDYEMDMADFTLENLGPEDVIRMMFKVLHSNESALHFAEPDPASPWHLLRTTCTDAKQHCSEDCELAPLPEECGHFAAHTSDTFFACMEKYSNPADGCYVPPMIGHFYHMMEKYAEGSMEHSGRMYDSMEKPYGEEEIRRRKRMDTEESLDEDEFEDMDSGDREEHYMRKFERMGGSGEKIDYIEGKMKDMRSGEKRDFFMKMKQKMRKGKSHMKCMKKCVAHDLHGANQPRKPRHTRPCWNLNVLPWKMQPYSELFTVYQLMSFSSDLSVTPFVKRFVKKHGIPEDELPPAKMDMPEWVPNVDQIMDMCRQFKPRNGHHSMYSDEKESYENGRKEEEHYNEGEEPADHHEEEHEAETVGNHTELEDHTDSPDAEDHSDHPEQEDHTEPSNGDEHSEHPEPGDHTDLPHAEDHSDHPEQENHTEPSNAEEHSEQPEPEDHTDLPHKAEDHSEHPESPPDHTEPDSTAEDFTTGGPPPPTEGGEEPPPQ